MGMGASFQRPGWGPGHRPSSSGNCRKKSGNFKFVQLPAGSNAAANIQRPGSHLADGVLYVIPSQAAGQKYQHIYPGAVLGAYLPIVSPPRAPQQILTLGGIVRFMGRVD